MSKTSHRIRIMLLPFAIAWGFGAIASADDCCALPDHTDHRAGHPRVISPHADYSNTPEYVGYFVGGDTPRHGWFITRAVCPPRREDVGTWGWDYKGAGCVERSIELFSSRGRKHGDGYGAYRTDGHHVPDFIAITKARIGKLKRLEH